VSTIAQAGTISSNEEKLFQASLSYLQKQASVWGIEDPAQEFQLRSVIHDDLGDNVRLDQVYQGIPVVGYQLVVHFDTTGNPTSVTGAYKDGINLKTSSKLSSSEAKGKAQEHHPGPVTKIPDSDLVLYVHNKDVTLAYQVDLENDEKPQRMIVFIDATTGKEIDSYDDLHTPIASSDSAGSPEKSKTVAQSPLPLASPTTGIGNSMYSGTVSITTNYDGSLYSMVDATRGNMSTNDLKNRGGSKGVLFTDTDNTWGNLFSSDRATAGVDAHFGSEMTWDYYLNIHGRKGIFNDSRGTVSRVHFRKNYNNAFWSDSCKCMTYGDGDGRILSPLTALDVVGHEMTHGVTSSTAALIYRGESGGLNEAMSDIFGTMLEFYASTHGASKTPNYLIGEDVYTPGTPGDALRYMDDPTLDGESIDTYANYTSSLDVHLSSGIANNAYYLIAHGGTHRLGATVTGIGEEKAEKIFYRALTVYMIPGETFSQARADTISAALDFPGISSAEVEAVKAGWSAVGVN
jgi:Zn-dependent metalloprotease